MSVLFLIQLDSYTVLSHLCGPPALVNEVFLLPMRPVSGRDLSLAKSLGTLLNAAFSAVDVIGVVPL